MRGNTYGVQNNTNNQLLSQSTKLWLISFARVSTNILSIWIVIDYFIGYYHGIREDINNELPTDPEFLAKSYQQCVDLFFSTDATNTPACANAVSCFDLGDNNNQFSGEFPVDHYALTDAVGSFAVTTLIIWFLNTLFQVTTTFAILHPPQNNEENGTGVLVCVVLTFSGLFAGLPALGTLDGWAGLYASFDGCIERCGKIASDYPYSIYDKAGQSFSDSTYPSVFNFNSSLSAGLTAVVILFFGNVFFEWLNYKIRLPANGNANTNANDPELGLAPPTETTALLANTSTLNHQLAAKAKEREDYPEELSQNAPDHLKCPISLRLMYDPVMVTRVDGVGITFERLEIEKWLKNNNTDPTSRVKLLNKSLVKNISIKNAIDNYLETQRNPSEAQSQQPQTRAQSQLFEFPASSADDTNDTNNSDVPYFTRIFSS